MSETNMLIKIISLDIFGRLFFLRICGFRETKMIAKILTNSQK